MSEAEEKEYEVEVAVSLTISSISVYAEDEEAAELEVEDIVNRGLAFPHGDIVNIETDILEIEEKKAKVGE